MENSSEVLAARAREIAKSLGYTNRPVDTAYGWGYDEDYFKYARDQKLSLGSLGRLHDLRHQRPPAVYFWYRTSWQYLNPTLDHDPAHFDRYMIPPELVQEVLDPEGRLCELQGRPREGNLDAHTIAEPDWNRLLAAASLEPAQLRPSQPVVTPGVPFEVKRAWVGPLDNLSGRPLQIEAAALKSRPVFFRLIAPGLDSTNARLYFPGVLTVRPCS
jgi:hypothetical protein